MNRDELEDELKRRGCQPRSERLLRLKTPEKPDETGECDTTLTEEGDSGTFEADMAFLEEHESKRPPPGSWAETARLMADLDPDFDWDTWKDEMKDSEY